MTSQCHELLFLCRVLCSTEVLSTDEESSNSGGESDEELGRNLETLLRGKKTTAQLSHEQEEAERQELRRMLAEDKPVSLFVHCTQIVDNDHYPSHKSNYPKATPTIYFVHSDIAFISLLLDAQPGEC